MDLFSQAEHDELAQSILLCPDAAYIDARAASIDRLLPDDAARRRSSRASLNGRGALIHTREHGRGLRDQQPHRARAPGSVSSSDPQRWEPLLRHAGAIFLGAYTSESAGRLLRRPEPRAADLAAPRAFRRRWASTTSRSARSLIEVSEAGAQMLGAIAAELAYGEGLQAHARAAEMRLKP